MTDPAAAAASPFAGFVGAFAAVAAGTFAGGESAFPALTERYRRELHVHWYRMLASFDEAEDAVRSTRSTDTR